MHPLNSNIFDLWLSYISVCILCDWYRAAIIHAISRLIAIALHLNTPKIYRSEKMHAQRNSNVRTHTRRGRGKAREIDKFTQVKNDKEAREREWLRWNRKKALNFTSKTRKFSFFVRFAPMNAIQFWRLAQFSERYHNSMIEGNK